MPVIAPLVTPLIGPAARIALRYALIAGTAYVVARRTDPARRDQRVEDALDELDEGISVTRDDEHMRAAGKFRRTVRLGRKGPGLEVELSGLGRLRVRRA